jgi:hypothetical protein
VKESWYGAVYDDVVSRWGVPKRHTTLVDGGYVYTWESEAVARDGKIYPSTGIFGASRSGDAGAGVTVAPAGSELVRCDRTLIFRNARVAQQTWQGDPDFCSYFKR